MVQTTEMRSRLKMLPNVLVGEDVDVIVDADEPCRVRQVRHESGERQTDRPDQRKDVDREQEKHRRGNEQPDDGPIGRSGDAPRTLRRRLVCGAIRQRGGVLYPSHHDPLWFNRVPPAGGPPGDIHAGGDQARDPEITTGPCSLA